MSRASVSAKTTTAMSVKRRFRAKANGLTGQHYPTVMDALKAAKAHAHARDLVIVCGSVFVVGEVE